MIELTFSILLLILIVLGIIESYVHSLSLAKLPIRIHVNGSRGKSSVTRLIASGLRAGGLKVIAKTTGTAPRIIDENGKDRIIHRLRSASIGEQVRLIRNFAKRKPDAVVFECMAVNPQYQWVAEQKMIKSTISIITNVRPDHLDEMGSTLTDNAMSLSNTIPFDGTLITAENKMQHVLENVAKKRNTKIQLVTSKSISLDYMSKFPYLEHHDNVAVALEVCKEAGIDESIALEGMLKAEPDPGATVIWSLNSNGVKNYFVNVFAANDPASTLDIWNQLQAKIKNSPTCIFLNTREDRKYRTNQLLSLIYNNIKPKAVIIRGENLTDSLKNYKLKNSEIKVYELSSNVNITDILKVFSELENYFIIGIGNIVGWGEEFIKNLKEYRV